MPRTIKAGKHRQRQARPYFPSDSSKRRWEKKKQGKWCSNDFTQLKKKRENKVTDTPTKNTHVHQRKN